MKNKILKFGSILVVVLFLMSGVSSALDVEIKEDVDLTNEVTDCFIDPNISLNRFHLAFLKRSLDSIKDSKLKDLVGCVIDGIKKDGVVDSEELSDIVEACDLSSSVRGIHCGFISGSCPCRDSYIAFPGMLKVILWSAFTMCGNWFRLFGYSTLVNWKSLEKNYHGCSIKVNGIHKYPKGHDGWIIGFMGYTTQIMTGTTSSQIPCDPVFSITGIGSIIIFT